MANIPLKTIKFPGLDDTYTVPQIDSSFTGVAGEAPDSNKVKGEIDSLKEDLNAVESMIPSYADIEWETGGISRDTGADSSNSAYRRVKGYIPSLSINRIISSLSGSVVAYVYIYEKVNDSYVYKGSTVLGSLYLVRAQSETRFLRVAIGNTETDKVQAEKNSKLIDAIQAQELLYNNYLHLENGSIYSDNGLDYDAGTYAVRTTFLEIAEFGNLFINPKYLCAIFVYNSIFQKIYATSWMTSIVLDANTIYEKAGTYADSAVYCRLIFKRANVSTSYLDPAIVMQDNVYRSKRDYNVNKSVCSGKNISIYGDSISTFSGWIPTGNATYYTGSNAGVPTVYDTWWMKTISALGMNLLVNNSWSGRAVSSIRDGQSGHSTDAGYKDANVLQLKKDDVLPDIIIIKLGINDFNSGALLGDYDGSTELPTVPTKFLDAYAIMLDLIMTNYPLADVYCCTLMQCERTGATGFPEINSRGDSIGKWNAGIVKLAHAFGAKVLNHDVCGLTYYNMSTYMGDYSSGSGLHPNASGHSLIANMTIKEMDNAVRIRF